MLLMSWSSLTLYQVKTEDYDGTDQWALPNSLMFAITIITTIGRFFDKLVSYMNQIRFMFCYRLWQHCS